MAQKQIFTISDFTGGINEKSSPQDLKPNECTELLNLNPFEQYGALTCSTYPDTNIGIITKDLYIHNDCINAAGGFDNAIIGESLLRYHIIDDYDTIALTEGSVEDYSDETLEFWVHNIMETFIFRDELFAVMRTIYSERDDEVDIMKYLEDSNGNQYYFYYGIYQWEVGNTWKETNSNTKFFIKPTINVTDHSVILIAGSVQKQLTYIDSAREGDTDNSVGHFIFDFDLAAPTSLNLTLNSIAESSYITDFEIDDQFAYAACFIYDGYQYGKLYEFGSSNTFTVETASKGAVLDVTADSTYYGANKRLTGISFFKKFLTGSDNQNYYHFYDRSFIEDVELSADTSETVDYGYIYGNCVLLKGSASFESSHKIMFINTNAVNREGEKKKNDLYLKALFDVNKVINTEAVFHNFTGEMDYTVAKLRRKSTWALYTDFIKFEKNAPNIANYLITVPFDNIQEIYEIRDLSDESTRREINALYHYLSQNYSLTYLHLDFLGFEINADGEYIPVVEYLYWKMSNSDQFKNFVKDYVHSHGLCFIKTDNLTRIELHEIAIAKDIVYLTESNGDALTDTSLSISTEIFGSYSLTKYNSLDGVYTASGDPIINYDKGNWDRITVNSASIAGMPIYDHLNEETAVLKYQDMHGDYRSLDDTINFSGYVSSGKLNIIYGVVYNSIKKDSWLVPAALQNGLYARNVFDTTNFLDVGFKINYVLSYNDKLIVFGNYRIAIVDMSNDVAQWRVTQSYNQVGLNENYIDTVAITPYGICFVSSNQTIELLEELRDNVSATYFKITRISDKIHKLLDIPADNVQFIGACYNPKTNEYAIVNTRKEWIFNFDFKAWYYNEYDKGFYNIFYHNGRKYYQGLRSLYYSTGGTKQLTRKYTTTDLNFGYPTLEKVIDEIAINASHYTDINISVYLDNALENTEPTESKEYTLTTTDITDAQSFDVIDTATTTKVIFYNDYVAPHYSLLDGSTLTAQDYDYWRLRIIAIKEDGTTEKQNFYCMAVQDDDDFDEGGEAYKLIEIIKIEEAINDANALAIAFSQVLTSTPNTFLPLKNVIEAKIPDITVTCTINSSDYSSYMGDLILEGNSSIQSIYCFMDVYDSVTDAWVENIVDNSSEEDDFHESVITRKVYNLETDSITTDLTTYENGKLHITDGYWAEIMNYSIILPKKFIPVSAEAVPGEVR